MTSWKHHVADAFNCLESITHLLKEEHATHTTQTEQSPDQNGDSNLNENVAPCNDVSNVSVAYNRNSNEECIARGNGNINDGVSMPIVRMSIDNDPMEALGFLNQGGMAGSSDGMESSTASAEVSTTSSANSQIQDIAKNEHGQMTVSISGNKEEFPEWFKLALLGESNLSPTTENTQNSSSEEVGCSAASSVLSPLLPVIQAGIRAPTPPVRPPSPYRFFIPLRHEDPVAFHLDAFDSPPPSPRREEEEFANNMEADPNGAIPDSPDNFPRDPEFPLLDIERYRQFGCTLEYCNSFGQFLITTEENVKDKKNILREMFNHVVYLLKKAAAEGPAAKMEDFIDLSASVALIHNSLGMMDDVASFKRFAATATDLVHTVQNAVKKNITVDRFVYVRA